MGCKICPSEDNNEILVRNEVISSKAAKPTSLDANVVNNSLNYIQATTTIPHLSAAVESIVQTKDNQIAVGYINGLIIVYDILADKSYEQAFVLQGHDGAVESLIKLEDGRLVSGGGDSTVRIWRVYERRLEFCLTNHSGWVNCVLELDAQHIISGSSDCTLCIWNIFTCQAEYVLRDEQTVNCIIKVNEHRIAANSGDSIKIWNWMSKEEEGHIPGAFSTVVSMICFDEKLIAGSINGQIRGFDVNTLHKIFTIKDSENLNCIILIGKGTIASTSGMDIKLWSYDSQTELLTLRGHTDEIHTLYLMDNLEIVSGSNDKMVKIWG